MIALLCVTQAINIKMIFHRLTYMGGERLLTAMHKILVKRKLHLVSMP